MVKVLFVCHGNICRSPMAEFVLRDLARKAGISLSVASAATHYDEIGSGVYPPARRKLAEHGLSCQGKTAQHLEKSDYKQYDYIIGMDSANLKNMHRICGGDPEGKFSLLLDWCGVHRDVSDPWYTGDFDRTWDDVYAGCMGLMEHLLKEEHHVYQK